MKKAIVLSIIFIVFVGSIGAFETNSITMLQCLVQCGICAVIAWGLLYKREESNND